MQAIICTTPGLGIEHGRNKQGIISLRRHRIDSYKRTGPGVGKKGKITLKDQKGEYGG